MGGHVLAHVALGGGVEGGELHVAGVLGPHLGKHLLKGVEAAVRGVDVVLVHLRGAGRQRGRGVGGAGPPRGAGQRGVRGAPGVTLPAGCAATAREAPARAEGTFQNKEEARPRAGRTGPCLQTASLLPSGYGFPPRQPLPSLPSAHEPPEPRMPGRSPPRCPAARRPDRTALGPSRHLPRLELLRCSSTVTVGHPTSSAHTCPVPLGTAGHPRLSGAGGSVGGPGRVPLPPLPPFSFPARSLSSSQTRRGEG